MAALILVVVVGAVVMLLQACRLALRGLGTIVSMICTRALISRTGRVAGVGAIVVVVDTFYSIFGASISAKTSLVEKDGR